MTSPRYGLSREVMADQRSNEGIRKGEGDVLVAGEINRLKCPCFKCRVAGYSRVAHSESHMKRLEEKICVWMQPVIRNFPKPVQVLGSPCTGLLAKSHGYKMLLRHKRF